VEEELTKLIKDTVKFPEVQDVKVTNPEELQEKTIEALASIFEKVAFLKGEVGDKGERGEKGIQGKNGEDGKDGQDGINGVDGKDGIDGKDGENGKDGAPDTTEEVKAKLEQVGLSISAIKGLEEVLKGLRIQRSLGGSKAIGPSVILRFINNETPTGAIDGANTDYRLVKGPQTDSLKVFVNGVRMRSGSSNDYTLLGNTLTFNTALLTDDVLLTDYEY